MLLRSYVPERHWARLDWKDPMRWTLLPGAVDRDDPVNWGHELVCGEGLLGGLNLDCWLPRLHTTKNMPGVALL